MKKETNVKTNVKKELFSWIRTIIIAVIITVIINSCVVFGATIPTGSMEDTLEIHDRIFTYRLSYLFKEPQRGDVVVFRFPDDESQRFVKRVIGLPNEIIQGIDGKIYINGSKTPLNEDYLKETPIGSFGPYTIPNGYYFMMGDNRNDSADSRFWVNKFLSKDKILGKAVLKYFPSIEVIK